ncbi:MAG: hypothetical protein Q9174_006702, partial [Haloplaca sp. 1 TL-2023]
MRLSTLVTQQAAVLLFIFLSTPYPAYATVIERRVNCPQNPTSANSAGIGVELETTRIVFDSKDCSKSDTDKSKGQGVANRQGDNWELTVDTSQNVAGKLNAEYILDGTKIKLDTGKAAEAAAAVADDIVISDLSTISYQSLLTFVLQRAWNPSADMADPKVDVKDSPCNPWTITAPPKGGSVDNIGWSVQVTAALPLEAIQDLIRKAIANEASALLPGIQAGRNVVYVTKEFFQAKPNDISSDSVKDDVLGFFSLVMSYAKGTLKFSRGDSPKNIISLMPRTDWTNLFKQVQSEVPGTLYDIVKILACYRYIDDEVDGTLDAPKSNGRIDQDTFTLVGDTEVKVSVKDWMQSIQDGQSPDKLSEADKVIDGSIGALKDTLNN